MRNGDEAGVSEEEEACKLLLLVSEEEDDGLVFSFLDLLSLLDLLLLFFLYAQSLQSTDRDRSLCPQLDVQMSDSSDEDGEEGGLQSASIFLCSLPKNRATGHSGVGARSKI